LAQLRSSLAAVCGPRDPQYPSRGYRDARPELFLDGRGGIGMRPRAQRARQRDAYDLNPNQETKINV
jgi:hypothetical protein